MTVAEFLQTITNPKFRIIICASTNETILVELYQHKNNYLADSINSAVIIETQVKNAYTIKLITNIEVESE